MENFEEKQIKISVGENLKELLRKKNRTVSELSEKTGISRPTIYRILESKSSLKLEDALKISRFLEVPIEALYGLENVDKIPKSVKVTPVFGMYQDVDKPGIQKLYKKLARKELAQILFLMAKLLDEE
ncbi:MAG: helix-turn-helix domain-containing protein [Caldiserica bacterium]|jgi:transcriptional regulator with XRE-family HTH domain|nr:helix-turn-helix domain-containing protein [Caldisericota bacterium]MDH7562265.1 helix-turn-helix transcriptional regulator [Caldisericota bacterium]